MMKIKWLMPVMIIVIASIPVMANPVNYNESSNGDLPQFPSGMSPLAFDTGINTVSGTMSLGRSVTGDLDIDWDSFSFTIPNNAVLSSIVVDSSSGAGTGVFDLTSYGLYQNSILISGNLSVYFPIPTADLALFNPYVNFPLGPLEFWMYHAGVSGQMLPGQSQSANYTFTFGVSPSPIPEPTSLLLLGTGLGALGLAAWRRRRN